jgi:hypothetical protein
MTDENQGSELPKETAAPATELADQEPDTNAAGDTTDVTETAPESTEEAGDEVDGGNAEADAGEGPDEVAEEPVQEQPAPVDEPIEELVKQEEKPVGSVVETAGAFPPATPKPVQPPTPIVQAEVPAPAPVVEAPAPAPQQAVPTLQTKSSDDVTLELFRNRVDEYINAMGRGRPVASDVGAQWQRKLFTIIDQILKLQGVMFNKAWTDLLTKVQANRQGAFSEKMAFRFLDKTKVDKAQMRNYQNLIHLIIHTADPLGRQKMLKLIDIASVTRNLQIPGAADKLYAYYNL